MKKISFLLCLMITIISLSGCKHSSTNVKVLIPSGSPTLGLIHMIHTVAEIEDFKIDYEVTSLVDELPTAITSKDYQIVVAPTNLGANLYNKDSGYIYTGAITFGNLYLVGHIDNEQNVNIDDLDKQTIAAFGEGSIPQILLEKSLESNGFQIVDEINEDSTEKQVIINYFDGVNNANGQFMANQYQFALLAEPVLSVSKTKNNDIITVIDIQKEYKTITDMESYPQAGIFINKEFIEKNGEFVTEFLNKVKASAEFVNDNNEEAANIYALEKERVAPQFPKEILVNAIPQVSIRYETAEDSKAELIKFLELIYDFKSALIGGKLPDDDFFFE